MTGPCAFCDHDQTVHPHDGRAWPCLVCSCDDFAQPGSVHDVDVTAGRLVVQALGDAVAN